MASKALHLTQSAVSHAIKALEDDLGCKLVDRIGKRVQLTQAGEQFLRHTENILREMQSARAGIASVSKWGQDRLRIGASTTACQHLLPGVLREFRESFPKCVIKIETGDHMRQLELLRAGHVDLSFLLEPRADISADLKLFPLFEDELRLFVSPQHPWAQLKRVPRDELEKETLILYNKTSYTFRLVADYFKEQKFDLRNYIELGSMEAIKELAKLGLGAGVLAPWTVGAEMTNGALVSIPIGEKKLKRQWSVAHWKGRRLSVAEEIFVGLCETVAKNFHTAELKVAG